jgi:hypothetical protein
MSNSPFKEEAMTKEPTARSLLVTWANGQDHWLRALVKEVIATRKVLSADEAAKLFELYLREKELAAGERVDVPKLADDAGSGAAAEAFALKMLENVRSVNALSAGQKIEFNSRLTVVFGENAAGKTGYVRVLKRAAGVRTAEEILPNVFAPTKETEDPQATLKYVQAGKDFSIEWKNEMGLSPFSRMDVFDARSARVHLDDELTYVYTPGEIALFPMVQNGIEQVQRALDGDIQKRVAPNPYAALFERGTSIYPKIEALGSATDLGELRRLGTLSPDEDAHEDGLRTELDALRSTTPQAHRSLAEAQLARLRMLHGATKTAESFDYGGYRQACERLQTAEEKHKETSAAAFQGTGIPGVLGDEWRGFIEAGEAYLHVHGAETYPREAELCIYCRQPLTTQAVALIKKYRDYCRNVSRQEVETADSALREVTMPIVGLDVPALFKAAEEYERQGGATALKLPKILKELEGLKVAVGAKGKHPWEQTLPVLQATRKKAEPEIESVSAQIDRLKKEGTEREKELQIRERALSELKARKLLRSHLSGIEEFVAKAQWVSKAKTYATGFRNLLRSLTETAKVASEQLLNKDFGRRFEEECVKLRAPKVRLEFPGRQGQVVRKKAVIAGHKPSDTLSEGEQKVIALADFLAEVEFKPAAPVIFDDPITSLDYRRMNEVVDRLVGLSASRQVIVFTHNIWFAIELLACFEKKPADCAYYDIRAEGERRGLVTKGVHPRADTFKTDKARINELMDGAKKAQGATQEALIEKAYEYLRNISEVIVETDLLQGVTQRYQPNVMMTRLAQIKVARLQAAIDGIVPIFEKACRVIGSHSQPLETLNVRPSLAELEADWKRLQEVRDDYFKAAI